MASPRSRILPVSAPARLAVLALVLCPALPGCLTSERWGQETSLLVVSRSGLYAGSTDPGPDPTGISGIEKAVPPIDETNVVEVSRISGRVQVRPGGERGARTLEYWRPWMQTGPAGVVLTGTNGSARVAYSDESVVLLHRTALVRVGDPAKGEPRLRCERLTVLELMLSFEPTLGPLELPGGALVIGGPLARVKVELVRDRFYRVHNDGKSPVELRMASFTQWLRPSESVDVPVLRNRPAPGEEDLVGPGAGAVVSGLPLSGALVEPAADGSGFTLTSDPSATGSPIRIGEASLATSSVQFLPLQDRRTTPNGSTRP